MGEDRKVPGVDRDGTGQRKLGIHRPGLPHQTGRQTGRSVICITCGPAPSLADVREVSNAAAKRAWARLIKQVYEVDPLACPRCTGSMRIIAFIEQPAVIAKILAHLGLWPVAAGSPPAGGPGAVFPATGRVAA